MLVSPAGLGKEVLGLVEEVEPLGGEGLGLGALEALKRELGGAGAILLGGAPGAEAPEHGEKGDRAREHKAAAEERIHTATPRPRAGARPDWPARRG